MFFFCEKEKMIYIHQVLNHWTGKIRFFGTQKIVLLKISSEGHCVPCNFVLLVALGGIYKCSFIVHLAVAK